MTTSTQDTSSIPRACRAHLSVSTFTTRFGLVPRFDAALLRRAYCSRPIATVVQLRWFVFDLAMRLMCDHVYMPHVKPSTGFLIFICDPKTRFLRISRFEVRLLTDAPVLQGLTQIPKNHGWNWVGIFPGGWKRRQCFLLANRSGWVRVGP